jgi:hypothetical protein
MEQKGEQKGEDFQKKIKEFPCLEKHLKELPKKKGWDEFKAFFISVVAELEQDKKQNRFQLHMWHAFCIGYWQKQEQQNAIDANDFSMNPWFISPSPKPPEDVDALLTALEDNMDHTCFICKKATNKGATCTLFFDTARFVCAECFQDRPEIKQVKKEDGHKCFHCGSFLEKDIPFAAYSEASMFAFCSSECIKLFQCVPQEASLEEELPE